MDPFLVASIETLQALEADYQRPENVEIDAKLSQTYGVRFSMNAMAPQTAAMSVLKAIQTLMAYHNYSRRVFVSIDEASVQDHKMALDFTLFVESA